MTFPGFEHMNDPVPGKTANLFGLLENDDDHQCDVREW